MFTSRIPFVESRIEAAAVYCSDGRFGEQIDDFLENSLQLPRYDRLCIPGGPACLAGHFVAFREEEATVNQLQFLMEVHHLRRIVLVSHHACAFYLERLKVTPDQVERRQMEDVRRACERIRGYSSQLQVEAYHARREGEEISFAGVPER